MMTINDHQSLLNITVTTGDWPMFPVSPGLRLVGCHQSGDTEIPLIGARHHLAPWWPPDCLAVLNFLQSSPSLVPRVTVIGGRDRRSLLTTICAWHTCLNVSAGSNTHTASSGHIETSAAVDKRERKPQAVFIVQVPVVSSSKPPELSHSPPSSHTNLMPLRSSHCHLIVPDDSAQVPDCSPSLSRGLSSSVTQSRMWCVTICVTMLHSQWLQSSSQCLLLWINLEIGDDNHFLRAP